MRKSFVGALSTMLASAGLALAQQPGPSQTFLPGEPRLLPRSAVTALPDVKPEAIAAPKDAAKDPVKDPAKDSAKEAKDAKTTTPGTEMVWVEEPLPGLAGRFYADAQYLLWWTKEHRLPPLVTSGGTGDLITTGGLGSSNTQILFGNEKVDDSARSGGLFTAGFWFSDSQEIGIEATLFYLAPTTTHFTSTSDGSTILAIPFINEVPAVNSGAPLSNSSTGETAYLVAFSSVTSGTVTASTSNQIWGAEGNLRYNLGGDARYRVDLLAGFRYIDVQDHLDLTAVSTPSANGFVVFQGQAITNATSLTVADSFRTRNEFYGGQIGTHIEFQRNRWFMDFRGKLGIGIMHQSVDINGATTLVTTTNTQTLAGGIFAQASNIGHHDRDEFGLVPEVGLTVGYQLTNRLRAGVGYNVLYFRSDVVRPGTTIDRTVNPNTIPVFSSGPATGMRPAFSFRDVDFWAQGLTATIEFSF